MDCGPSAFYGGGIKITISVHDNQSLSYGVRYIGRQVPTTITIHHPITVDRALDIQSVRMPWSKLKRWRWYSFIPMQKRVARSFRQIITVSDFTKGDISREFNVPEQRFRVVPNGIKVDIFKPLDGVERAPDRLITTNSADVPLKGLKYLLLALAKVNQKRDVHLTVVGTPKKKSPIPHLISALDLDSKVHFTGRIDTDEFVYHYARSTAAVVPSPVRRIRPAGRGGHGLSGAGDQHHGRRIARGGGGCRRSGAAGRCRRAGSSHRRPAGSSAKGPGDRPGRVPPGPSAVHLDTGRRKNH